MSLLLGLAAVLVLVSGLVKMRAWARFGAGVHVLPLLEIVAGIGLLVLLLTGPPGPSSGLWLIAGSVAVVVASSVMMALDVRRRGRRRTLSEGARLANYVRYLSRSPRDD